MDESKKRNIIIVVAFLLPFLFIIGVLLTTYIPSRLLKTNYNFVYAVCDNNNRYNCESYLGDIYKVTNNRLEMVERNDRVGYDYDLIMDIDENINTHLFIYDVETNTSNEITFSDAQNLNLSNLISSPEGVIVSSGYDYGGSFIFGGRSNYRTYLKKGDKRKEIDLIYGDEYYQRNYKFIGWIIK